LARLEVGELEWALARDAHVVVMPVRLL